MLFYNRVDVSSDAFVRPSPSRALSASTAHSVPEALVDAARVAASAAHAGDAKDGDDSDFVPAFIAHPGLDLPSGAGTVLEAL